MMPALFKIAIRNLVMRGKRTTTMAILIGVGMAGLFFVDSVFEGTISGLKKSFVGSLTGDAAVIQGKDSSIGLFGSEIPIVSEYEAIPPISASREVSGVAGELRHSGASTRIVSAAAKVDIGGYSFNAPVFGVEADSYLAVCDELRVAKGDFREVGEGGVFLNSAMARAAEAGIGRDLIVGEAVSMSMYQHGSFRIRKGRYAGEISYPASNSALDRIVLADPTIVRALADYTMGFAQGGTEGDVDAENGGADSFDLTSLFGQAADSVADDAQSITLSSVERQLADAGDRDALVQTDDAAWSFFLFKAKTGEEAELIAELRRITEGTGMDVRVQDWKQTAGSAAMLPYAVRIAFQIGLGVIMFGVVLIIMNALVVSVMERTSEIGTMRGLGASRRFIRGIFMVESIFMTVSASMAGIILGAVAAYAVGKMGVRVENELVVSLFGGDRIVTSPTAGSVLKYMALSAAIGFASSLYPVSLALGVQPAGAIAKDF